MPSLRPTTDAVIIARPSGEIAFWGRGAQNVFGYDADEVAGKPLADVLSLPRLGAGGTFRINAARKNGRTFRAGVVVEPWASGVSITVRDESRWTLFADVVSVMSDHRSFAAAAPRVADCIGRASGFDAVAIWIMERGEPRRIVWWSAGGGAPRESGLLGDLRQKRETAFSDDALAVPILERGNVAGAIELLCAPGTEINMSVVDELTRIAASAGRFIARERMSADLRASEVRYRLLFDHSIAAICITTKDGVITDANRAFAAMFGYDDPKVIRDVHFENFLADASEWTRIRDASSNRETEGLRDGRSFWMALNVTPLPHGNGDLQITAIDVDAMRKVAESRRLASLGQLAATMAHEFNNVLMGIATFVEVLRRRAGSEPHVQNAVMNMQQSLTRGQRITEEILRFTREPAPVNATIDVRRWLTDFLPEASALTGARAELKVAGDLYIRGDIALLNQVLVNLVINARDAAPDGPIEISARRRDDQLDLVVLDHGKGIPPEVRRRIFEPLFTTKRTGTGLGLAVVHQVVTAHGGTIDVQSDPGHWTKFHLYFPLVAKDAAPEAMPPRRVLLVEDDPAVTLALNAVMEVEGMNVRTVANGRAALAAIESEVPDVVLLDIGLPDVSGVDVYGEIDKRWPRLPVLFITASVDEEAVAHFLRRPHVGLLKKPFEAAQLLETLSRMALGKRANRFSTERPARNARSK